MGAKRARTAAVEAGSNRSPTNFEYDNSPQKSAMGIAVSGADFRFEQGQNNYDTNSAFVSLVSFE